LTGDVFERAKSALNDLKMSERDKQSVGFFTVYGMDLFFAGSTKTVKGSLIGIPRNYSYKCKEEIERKDIVVSRVMILLSR
jgi:hypothetical protein